MPENEFSIDPNIQMGTVTLSVADLERTLQYYQENIGLQLLQPVEDYVILGAGDTPLLKLIHQPGAVRSRNTTGLYHYALLLPSRLELARTLQHLINTHTQFTGAADHLVSEALYLNDPDGHGIEIYRDRSRSKWYTTDDTLKMDTVAFDIDSVLGELSIETDPWNGISPQTIMGHVHLHVADLTAATNFYGDILGFGKPPITVSIPSAEFVGAGGYHHHLGLNIWAGIGAPPPPPEAVRLISFEINFPNQDALNAVIARLVTTNYRPRQIERGWEVLDPSQNALILKTLN
jgi:catechol 2,3-dioxygenase